MTDGSERREHPRARIAASATLLVRHNAGVAFLIESISIGGARLAGPLTLEVGETVQLLFEIDGAPIDVQAEVVRVDRQDLMTDHIAVAFRDLSVTTRTLIHQFVLTAFDEAGPADE